MLTEDERTNIFEPREPHASGNKPHDKLTNMIIQGVADHKKESGTYIRGKKHSVPKNAQDVQKLYDLYRASAYHTFTRGRKTTEPKITN